MRHTPEEWIAFVNSLVEWAKVLRRYYDREECECCGASYHPKDGDPPNENECKKGEPECYCGHAGMREMHRYWDRDTGDWIED
jgi:hypothetical protein